MGMPLLRADSVEVRDYQKNIADTASQKNTLVVLPTGMGKTLISVLVGAKRLEEFPDSKILITAPTRPLNAQHKNSFEKLTHIPKGEIALVTGKIAPQDRKNIYKESKIIVATPQTIRNDLENEILNLEGFSFITFDESHRAVKDYAYSYIAKKFMMQSKNPLILALTASPGWTESKIREICDNLFIKAVEIRSETDSDVESYVKQIERDFVYVDFPEDFKKIRDLLQEILKEDMEWLKEKHYVPTTVPSRAMLIGVQNRMSARYSATKNYIYIWPIIRSAEAIKVSHAIELIETQGIPFLYEYLEKMKASKKRTDARMMKHGKMMEVVEIVEKMHGSGFTHPKIDKLREIAVDLIQKNPKCKIIVFANYRSAVEEIRKILEKDNIPTEILVGQAMKNGRGMTQDEQIEVLRRFREGEFNVLCGTSVSEEGIDVPAVDYVVFYEAVPSEIRAIQRRGRAGRQIAGKAIFLITKNTRDQAYFFSSLNKEKKMKSILEGLKDSKKLERKKTLIDWVR